MIVIAERTDETLWEMNPTVKLRESHEQFIPMEIEKTYEAMSEMTLPLANAMLSGC